MTMTVTEWVFGTRELGKVTRLIATVDEWAKIDAVEQFGELDDLYSDVGERIFDANEIEFYVKLSGNADYVKTAGTLAKNLRRLRDALDEENDISDDDKRTDKINYACDVYGLIATAADELASGILGEIVEDL